MYDDAVFQPVLANEFTVGVLFLPLAYDVERPLAVVAGKQAEGLYQQVEALMLVREASDGQKTVGSTVGQLSRSERQRVVDKGW